MLVYFELAIAILPAALLLLLVYKKDKNGKEPKDLLWKLIFAGGIIIIPIFIYEFAGQYITLFINALITGSDTFGFWGNAFVNFGIVAFAEEGCKMIALAILTWKNDNFNFKYDGIVYAVFVGMGFAIFENLKYVLKIGGVGTGFARALTAIPGHCSFAIIMGTFYGLAKYFQSVKNKKMQVLCMLYAIVIPMIGHGLYDFVLTLASDTQSIILTLVGIFYMIVLDIFVLVLLLYQSKHDQFIVGSYKKKVQNPMQQPRFNPQVNSPAYNGYINSNDYNTYINPENVVPNMYKPNDFKR